MTNRKEPFLFKKNQPTIWFHKSKARSNQYCLYCHRPVSTDGIESDKEHLIGRSFVPDGSFDGGRAFNFIFRACKECNNEKAELERHISSVSLFNSPGRADADINALAERKAASDFHPIEKGKLVKDALFMLSAKAHIGSINVCLGGIGPPQLDHSRVRLLAFRHIQGLFSLVASTDPMSADGTKLLPSEHWWFGGSYPHSDWGNARLREIEKRVETWGTCLFLETANGYFKAVIHCAPHAEGPWFWALEWNKSLRLFGGIFAVNHPPAEFQDLPSPEYFYLGPERTSKEVPLDDHEDTLFKVDTMRLPPNE